jgi:hypothetical protein
MCKNINAIATAETTYPIQGTRIEGKKDAAIVIFLLKETAIQNEFTANSNSFW